MSAVRLEPLTPEQMDNDQRALYDAVMDSPRAQGPGKRILQREDGSLGGPFDALLRTPELGRHIERAGMAFRTDTSISPAVREVITLVVARAWGANFEWWVHGIVARRSGVSEEAIDAIGHGKRPSFDDPECEVAHDVALEQVHERKLSEATLERARTLLGDRGVVEAVALVGFYQLVSGILVSFEPPPPSGDLPVVGPPTSGPLP